MKSRVAGGSGTGASSSTVAGSTAAERRTASSPAACKESSRSTSRSTPGTGNSSEPRQTPTCWVPSDVLKVLHRTRRPRPRVDLGAETPGCRRRGCELAARDRPGQGALLDLGVYACPANGAAVGDESTRERQDPS